MFNKYFLIAGALSVFLVGLIAFDYGRDFEKARCQKKSFAQAVENIDVERVQNEIRNRAVSDDDFINVLRRGEFGRP